MRDCSLNISVHAARLPIRLHVSSCVCYCDRRSDSSGTRPSPYIVCPCFPARLDAVMCLRAASTSAGSAAPADPETAAQLNTKRSDCAFVAARDTGDTQFHCKDEAIDGAEALPAGRLCALDRAHALGRRLLLAGACPCGCGLIDLHRSHSSRLRLPGKPPHLTSRESAAYIIIDQPVCS